MSKSTLPTLHSNDCGAWSDQVQGERTAQSKSDAIVHLEQSSISPVPISSQLYTASSTYISLPLLARDPSGLCVPERIHSPVEVYLTGCLLVARHYKASQPQNNQRKN